MRTDRNGSPLAILIIELPANRASATDFTYLGRLLAERLRITDTVGLISVARWECFCPTRRSLARGKWRATCAAFIRQGMIALTVKY